MASTIWNCSQHGIEVASRRTDLCSQRHRMHIDFRYYSLTTTRPILEVLRAYRCREKWRRQHDGSQHFAFWSLAYCCLWISNEEAMGTKSSSCRAKLVQWMLLHPPWSFSDDLSCWQPRSTKRRYSTNSTGGDRSRLCLRQCLLINTFHFQETTQHVTITVTYPLWREMASTHFKVTIFSDWVILGYDRWVGDEEGYVETLLCALCAAKDGMIRVQATGLAVVQEAGGWLLRLPRRPNGIMT